MFLVLRFVFRLIILHPCLPLARDADDRFFLHYF